MPIRAHNPYPTHKEWKAEKKKYGIPDKVVKYSMGAKLGSFSKEFDKSDFTNNLTLQTLPLAEKLHDDSKKVYNEYLSAVNKLDTKKFKHKTLTSDQCKAKTTELLKTYLDRLASFKAVMETVSDPFARPRVNIAKAKKLLKEAIEDKEDKAKISTMYSNGMRNDLGVFFNEAAKEYKKKTITLTPEVAELIANYNKIMEKWNSPIDMQKVDELLEDMQKAMSIGEKILEITKP